MTLFNDFLETLRTLHADYTLNQSNRDYAKPLDIKEERFKKIFPSDDYSNAKAKEIAKSLRLFFSYPQHLDRLNGAIIRASALELNEEDEARSITTASNTIDLFFGSNPVSNESRHSESPFWIETIEDIYKRQTPKHENPDLTIKLLERMNNGDRLQASWTYRDGDIPGHENKCSDFHLVKRDENFFLFCEKKDGNLESRRLTDDQDILDQIHNIVTTLNHFDEKPRLKTVENIKQGRFIETAKIESPVIRHAPFEEPRLDGLLRKLNANANLEDEDKSLLLMISSFFTASQGVSENFQRPLNLDETKNLIRFLNNGLDAVEDPLFAARITLCNQEKLSSMRDLPRVIQEFFQGSQHAPFTKDKAVTTEVGGKLSAEEKSDILSGKKYCFCKVPGGGDHYFGAVFGEEKDGERTIYIQDSTETTSTESYKETIDSIWPTEERGSIKCKTIKTVKKRFGATILPYGGIGVQNQCRYSAIAFSEQVIDELNQGSRPHEGSIKYGEEDFVTRFAKWFDESLLGKGVMAATKEGGQVYQNNSHSSSMAAAGGGRSNNSDHVKADSFNPEPIFKELEANFLKSGKEAKEAGEDNLGIMLSLTREQRDLVLTFALSTYEGDSYTNRIAGLIAKCEEQEKQATTPQTSSQLEGVKEKAVAAVSSHFTASNNSDAVQADSFNQKDTFERMKLNFLKSGEEAGEDNLGIMLSLTREQRDSVLTFALSTYEGDSYRNRISDLITECNKPEKQATMAKTKEGGQGRQNDSNSSSMAAGGGGRSNNSDPIKADSFNPKDTFEKMKTNFKKSGEEAKEAGEANLEIMLRLSPLQRDSVSAFSLSTYEGDSYSDRISRLIAKCEEQEKQAKKVLQPEEEVAPPKTNPTGNLENPTGDKLASEANSKVSGGGCCTIS